MTHSKSDNLESGQKKKKYIKPVVERVALDNSITLVMMTRPPRPPMPRGSTAPNQQDNPFASPFEDKPFG